MTPYPFIIVHQLNKRGLSDPPHTTYSIDRNIIIILIWQIVDQQLNYHFFFFISSNNFWFIYKRTGVSTFHVPNIYIYNFSQVKLQSLFRDCI
ncbi:hypothetical protein LguiA_005956 [Lonicera macranthoides]